MTKLTSENSYPFSYLYDETQEITGAYRVIYTSDVFICNEELSLIHRGRMNDSGLRKSSTASNNG
jgi:hypothetical protein